MKATVLESLIMSFCSTVVLALGAWIVFDNYDLVPLPVGPHEEYGKHLLAFVILWVFAFFVYLGIQIIFPQRKR